MKQSWAKCETIFISWRRQLITSLHLSANKLKSKSLEYLFSLKETDFTAFISSPQWAANYFNVKPAFHIVTNCYSASCHGRGAALRLKAAIAGENIIKLLRNFAMSACLGMACIPQHHACSGRWAWRLPGRKKNDVNRINSIVIIRYIDVSELI